MRTDTLNKVRYNSLDFDSHVDELRSRLQLNFAEDFNDFSLSSLGIVLLDIISFGLDNLSFYLDRRASEAYLETARTRKGVARLSRQLGYKMSPAVPSSVDISVKVTKQFSFNVSLKKGFKFLGPDNIVFESARDLTFEPGEQGPGSSVKSVACYQGKTVSESFVSDGSPNQSFELARVPEGDFVAGGSVRVLVDGASFEEEEFLVFEKTDHFEVGYNDSPPTIRFGDGISGNIPKEGATIDVTYISSRGKSGQVSRNSVIDVVNPLVVNFATIPLEVNNSEGSVGGDDPETLLQAKRFAPKVFKSRNVAITREDYESLAESFADPLFGRVSAAQAISARSVENDLRLLSLLSDIRFLVSGPKPEVDVEIASINSLLDTEVDLLNEMEDYLIELAGLVGNSIVSVGQTLSNSKFIRNKALDVLSETADIQAMAGDVSSEIEIKTDEIDSNSMDARTILEGVSLGAADELTEATRDNLVGFLNDILSASGDIDDKRSELTKIITQSQAISSASSTIQTSAEESMTILGGVKFNLNDIGEDVEDGSTKVGKISDGVDDLVSSISSVRNHVLNIQILVLDVSLSVEAKLAKIRDHVDALLSQDCKANLVSVPILSRDLAGFLAPPSNGLIQSLQRFLDERKEVTQTVVVTSGEQFLIPIVLEVSVGVFERFSEATARNDVIGVVEGVIRSKGFGESVFESDICCEVEELESISYVNVNIKGHLSNGSLDTSKLDNKGNLIISPNEIITKGEITVGSLVVKG